MRPSSTLNATAIWTALGSFQRSPVGRVVSRALVLGFLAFLGVRLWRLWDSSALDLSDVRPVATAAAVVASVVAVVSYGCVWLVVLRGLGIAARPAQLGLFLKSQLGKYIPGSVWQYAGRVGLGRAEEIPANVGLASIAVEVAASLAAAVIVGTLVLPLWAAVSVGAAAVAAVAVGTTTRARRIFGRVAGLVPKLDGPLVWQAGRIIPRVLPLYGLVWLAYGTAFWLTARALFGVPASDIPLYVGGFAFAWAVGFIAIFAPGGVGVREAVLVALLAGHLGEARAIVLAGASRIVLTTIDLALGGLSLTLRGPRVRRAQTLEVRR